MHKPNHDPLRVASQLRRLGQGEHGWETAFQAITAVSMVIVTGKMLLDLLRDSERHKGRGRD